ncbi:MAG: hypothetical protein PVF70_05940 [Anaerolineales bacterium]
MVPGIPQTGLQERVEQSVGDLPKSDPNARLRAEFIASVMNGNADQVVGVYVPGVLSLPIVQQPSGNSGFVSTKPAVVTQFGMAAKYGTIGLLAHNTLSGDAFFNLRSGQYVDIIYGDGAVKKYQIFEILQYQALSPNSPYSDFLDLANGNRRQSARDLFYQVYTGGDRVVFQTCIAANGVLTWGRHFVIGFPATNLLKMQRAYAVVH